MAEKDIWCEGNCKTDEAHYLDDGNGHIYKDKDGQTYVCNKHHWACDKCNKIVQVG